MSYAPGTTGSFVGEIPFGGEPPGAGAPEVPLDAASSGSAAFVESFEGEMDLAVERPGRYAGPERELGRGGIGRVVAAKDRQLGRDVAIKELLQPGDGAWTPQALRFLREARVTAQLEHPGIVPVYELGRRADGRLYYTMRRVRGRTLADTLSAAEGLPGRLLLLGHVVDLCQAIGYAHSRGVIHRDIKPQNVMVGAFGETMVLDWGLARLRSAGSSSEEEPAHDVALWHAPDLGRTVAGTTLGTPTYMSPEQAHGRTDEVDERSDVWSLGVVLYELLAGTPPFRARSAFETLQLVRDGVPPPIAEREPAAPAELVAVVEKALQRDPAARYASAGELARDLVAWQNGERVQAHAYTSRELVRRFVARHRAALRVAAVATVGILLVSLVGGFRVVAERDRAQLAEQETAENLAESLVEQAALAWEDRDGQRTWLSAARALTLREDPHARGLLMAARSAWLPDLIDRVVIKGGCARIDAANGTFAAICKERVFVPRSGSWAELGAAGRWQALSLGTGGKHVCGILSVSDAVCVSLGDGEIGLSSAMPGDWLRSLVTVPGQNAILMASAEGWMRRLGDGPEWELRLDHGVEALAVAPDAATFAVSTLDGQIHFRDLLTGERVGGAPLLGHAAVLRYAPDGRALVATGFFAGGSPRIAGWDLDAITPPSGGADWELVHPTAAVTDVVFFDGGRLLVGAGADGRVAVWDVASRGLIARFDARVGRIAALAVDAGVLAVAGPEGVSRWRPPPMTASERLPGHAAGVFTVAFIEDGRRLISAGIDGRVLVRDTENRRILRRFVLPAHGGPRSIALLPGTSEALVGFEDRSILRIDLGPAGQALAHEGALTDEPVAEEPVDGPLITLANKTPIGMTTAPDPGGRAVVNDVYHLVFLDPGGGVRHAVGTMELGWYSGVELDGSGTRLFTAKNDGPVELSDAVTGTVLRTRDYPGFGIKNLLPSPDGRLLAVTGEEGRLVLASADDLEPQLTLSGLHDTVGPLVWSSGGERLWAATSHGELGVWRVSDGVLLARVEAHSGRVFSVALSPDARWVATGGGDHRLGLWKADTLELDPAAALAEAQGRFGGEVRAP